MIKEKDSFILAVETCEVIMIVQVLLISFIHLLIIQL